MAAPFSAAKRDGAGPPPSARKRLAPADRREQILEAAVQHFAEVGFDGGTRGVAERLSVTQPLIYRYFPSKEDLLQAVYERVYLSRWRTEWPALITDRSMPLRARLLDFYHNYTEAVFAPEWIRIYVFSGLRGLEIHRSWLAFINKHLLSTICGEFREEYGAIAVRELPITDEELEAYWIFHGGLFYYGMRREVYGVAPKVPLPMFIEDVVDATLHGYPRMMLRIVADAKTSVGEQAGG